MLRRLESEFSYQALDAALFLLGLRNAGVDDQLRRFASSLPAEPNPPEHPISTDRFLAALDDQSISRCDFSDFSPYLLGAYAWLTPTEDEIAPLLEALQRQASKPHRLSPPPDVVGAEQEPSPGWQPARFLIYDVVRMFGSVSHHGIIDELPCHGRLETALRALSLGQEPPAPTHAPTFFSHWPALQSSVFQRDPMTLSFLGPRWWKCLPKDCPHRWTLLVNIDGMKWSNDSFGFQIGNTMIRSVAETLHQIVGDRSLRWRGDEWLVMSDREDGFALAQHITKIIADTTLPISSEESHADPSEKHPSDFGARMTAEGFRFTVSIGVSSHRNFDTALEQAQEALVLSKTNGRNCVALG